MFFSRLSRQTTAETPEPQTTESDPHSASSPQGRMSEASEGYPSWLPKRPPPPAPQSSIGRSESVGGRKPTPRSLRVVSLQEHGRQRQVTDQTRVPSNTRVWSRATAMTPTVFDPSIKPTRPKFRAPGLHLELLRDPSVLSHIYFCLNPFLVFGHILLQLFFDFNAVFILVQVSKFPDPLASGVPGSGRNWSLGTAAYIASTAIWILVVFVVYEIIYSFARRWRLKRPLILPIYMSSPAFNLASLTSYSRFCFLQHLRWSAFTHSIRQGLAETFYFYSQNLPTVALLLPRAGLSMALLFAFTSPKPTVVALADAGIVSRDRTFFRPQDGTLTNYARGVLIANAAWTGWRVLVFLISCIGLWVLSGHTCAGLCGPRFRWEEEAADEKQRMSIYSNADSDVALEWDWKENTRLRVQDAYEFCLTTKRPKSAHEKNKKSNASEGFDGIEKVMAAVGLGRNGGAGEQEPVQVRRGVMSDDFFKPEVAAPTPAEGSGTSPDKTMLKDGKTLYPFTMTGAQVSSKDTVPFPPSPRPSGGEKPDTDEEEEEEDDEEEEEEAQGYDDCEEASSPGGRTSESMSSLGQPINSRYPFQYRHPRGRGSLSSGATHLTPSTRTGQSSNNSRSTPYSRSTGADESTDSHMSPRSRMTTRSDVSSAGGGIPLPPPTYPGRRRSRAGTVPTPGSPPVAFPRAARTSTRTRAESSTTDRLSSIWGMPDSSVDMSEALETSGEIDAAVLEDEDILGLLSASPSSNNSPRSSLGMLRQRASTSFGRRGSRADSQSSSSPSSRSRHNSIVSSARSRAQSLIQSFSQHSSLVDLTRVRMHGSMTRLEEEHRTSGHSRSGSSDVAFLSGSEGNNHTFGQQLPAMRMHHGQEVGRVEEEEEVSSVEGGGSLRSPRSATFSTIAPSENTVSNLAREPSGGVPIPVSPTRPSRTEEETTSHRDMISTAAQSFVTAPATIEGTSDSSQRGVPSSWGAISIDRPDEYRPA